MASVGRLVPTAHRLQDGENALVLADRLVVRERFRGRLRRQGHGAAWNHLNEVLVETLTEGKEALVDAVVD